MLRKLRHTSPRTGVRLPLMAKRVFRPSGAREKAVDYHGGCRFVRLSPDVASQGVKSLNIDVPFEEALKLRLALDSCLHAINRFHRGTSKGRSMGVLLSLKTENSSIVVIESAMRSSDAGD